MKVKLQRNIQDIGKAGETLSVGTEYGMRLISQGQAVLEKRKAERKTAVAPKASELEKPKAGGKPEKDCDSHGPV